MSDNAVNSDDANIVGVRFSKVGKIYHFKGNGDEDIIIGDWVVVQTSRGVQLGEVAQMLDTVPDESELKPISRRATPRDLVLYQEYIQKEDETVEITRELAKKLGMSGIKIAAAEYSFDGSSVTVLFSSEGEEKVDVKNLRRELQKFLHIQNIDIRQIGPRDVAKIIGGMGACGLEKRCCCSFLSDFSSISIRMAKEQGVSLTPSEITGMCGRLRCCLKYEYEQYAQARKGMPKKNKRVMTPQGEGKVVSVLALKGVVVVDIPDVGRKEFEREEIKPASSNNQQKQ
jgi:cell fate regulator YaaT (PSP1 superfamily)